MKYLFTALIVFMIGPSMRAQTAKIEYIAHAAFIIESENGSRVLIDPYHSYSQLGYTFPSDLKVDFILVTHPHFDHDGTKVLGENIPVYRKTGTYAYNDIRFYGILSKHKGWAEMDKRGRQSYNIIWVVEINNIKIAHLGDNALLSKEEIKLLYDIDYVIGHPENDSFGQFSKETTYIPNHYLLPEISKHTNWMEPIDEWLANKNGVVKLKGNTLELATKKNTTKILVFKPSSKVEEWSQGYYDALNTTKKAFKEFSESKNTEKVILTMNTVIQQSPYTIEGYLYKAVFLSRTKKNKEAVAVLEEALVKVPNIDWAMEINIRKMLAKAYTETAQMRNAYDQYLLISKLGGGMVNKKIMDESIEFIKKYTMEH